MQTHHQVHGEDGTAPHGSSDTGFPAPNTDRETSRRSRGTSGQKNFQHLFLAFVIAFPLPETMNSRTVTLADGFLSPTSNHRRRQTPLTRALKRSAHRARKDAAAGRQSRVHLATRREAGTALARGAAGLPHGSRPSRWPSSRHTPPHSPTAWHSTNQTCQG